MDNEFKFRALTSEDWEGIEHETLTYDGGVRLKKDKGAGTYKSKPLDSGIEGCRWHRIVLGVDIPENSTLTVSFYTSDKEEDPGSWSGTIVFKSTKDALVQAPPGRYIRLKIDFHSEGEESPVLRQVKIYYPRLSYLRYLPAVYQEDSASKEFLERFLSIFESALHDSEETISRMPIYFDPMAAPKDFVPWLAGWLSLDLYELLGDKNREYILRAMEFYKQKGTASGIAGLVYFLTGEKYRVCVKEYMNNVFRTYGMEHNEEDETEELDERGCTTFYRKMSRTVDTTNSDLLAKMGTYYDDVHYVTDPSETGRYSPHVIGLFIFLPLEEKEFIIKKDELHKIINSFLPVFVRAEINIVEEIYEVYYISAIIDEYRDHVHGVVEEEFNYIGGSYIDNVNWNWLYAHNGAYNGYSNDLQYRTPHSKIGVDITL